MLSLYNIFHLNLMFSSIEVEDRPLVIKKCYWPLFKLVKMGIPIGIEATGKTLTLINDLDRDWILTLKSHVDKGEVEFIGSGYSQIIGPLVPAKVNDWNQKIGIDMYNQILGNNPKIALINEMAYSAGIVEHYLKHGYEAIIMEWNNPKKYNKSWNEDLKYFPQKVVGANGETIPIIWAETIAFQKFQRYAHGEYSLNNYVSFLKRNNIEMNRFFPMYSNDVEIFDYRPSRYHNEAKIKDKSEWESIMELYDELNSKNWVNFIFPSQLLDVKKNKNSYNELHLESPEQPIPVKKQEKYNINRWALTGKDDLVINTKCFKIYQKLTSSDNSSSDNWKELCYLWSSDFRTHITQKRWDKYKERLDKVNSELDLSINLNTNKKKISFPFAHKNNELTGSISGEIIKLENKKMVLELDQVKGLSIRQCIFKEVTNKPLFGTLEHGYFNDISYAEDYFSGNSIIERLGQHMISDINETSPISFIDGSSIILESNQKIDSYWGNVKSEQQIGFESQISLQKNGIKINKRIVFEDDLWWRTFLGMAVIRPFNLTFNPDSWDVDTLYYKTHNGGTSYEVYHPEGKGFNHGNIYSSLISSMHGLGMTNGVMIVGDKDKEIKIKCDMTKSSLIPSIIFHSLDDFFFFRIQYSAKEIDETVSKKNELNSLELEFFIS